MQYTIRGNKHMYYVTNTVKPCRANNHNNDKNAANYNQYGITKTISAFIHNACSYKYIILIVL